MLSFNDPLSYVGIEVFDGDERVGDAFLQVRCWGVMTLRRYRQTQSPIVQEHLVSPTVTQSRLVALRTR